MKKKVIAIIMGLMMVVGSNSLIYAEEQNTSQTYNWVQEGEAWRLKDAAGNYVVNDWFKDSTGSWYFMGADGAMLDGIINDNGHYYFLQTALEGQGKMVTTDGVYNGVNLTFNQDVNSPTYGEITSGVQQLIGTGTRMTNLTITTTRTVGTVTNNGGQQNAPASGTQQQQVSSSNPFADWDNKPSAINGLANLTPQEKEELNRAFENLDKNR